MHYARKTRVLLAALLVFGLPAAVTAQSSEFSVDVHGGLSAPVGTLGDLTTTGGAYGAGLVWHASRHVGVRADFLRNKLDNGLSDTGLLLSPPVDLTFFGGAFELNFGSPLYQDLPLTFAFSLGVGVTNFDVDETFSPTHPANGVDDSYLTWTLGGQVGFQAIRQGSTRLNIFFKAQPNLILVDSFDMLPYAQLLGSDPFDSVWVVPLTLGARVTFGGN
ncbi:MAG: hypothetical protein ACE5FP_03050 [Gemmatimonadota bacterium]